MEENKKEQFDKIDELLKNTSAENRIKFDTISNEQVSDTNTGDDAINTLFESPENDEQTDIDISPINDIPAQSISSEEEAEEDDETAVCIIDETSTTVELSENTDFYQNGSASNIDGTLVQKQPKQKVKFNALQIVLMCVVGIVLLWCIIFTVDHTLASQGYSPVFCVETQKYEDGSANYTGLGYKIQFRFDSSDNLTQKCVPIWKDGPNDIADKQESGASFQ
jgi:hypothetical protein